MRLLDRYIRHEIFIATALVMLVLFAVESVLNFFAELSNLDVGTFKLTNAFLVVIMQLPADMYQLFPMTGFLGCLIALGRLASSSELIVMRASGISVIRITGSVVKAAIVMVTTMTLIGEWVAPRLEMKAEQIKTVVLGKYLTSKINHGIWLRNKRVFIHIRNVKDSKHITNIDYFRFDAQHQLLMTAVAPQGILQKKSWRLHNVRASKFMDTKIKFAHHTSRLLLGVDFDPLALQKSDRIIKQKNILSLYKTLCYQRHAFLNTVIYEFALWQRMVQPMTTFLMIFLGVPFIFGSLRSASMGVRILIGIVIGFSFYTLNQFFGPLAMVFQI